jgi:hypothetical protein
MKPMRGAGPALRSAWIQGACGGLLGLLLFVAICPGASRSAGSDGFLVHEDSYTYVTAYRYFIWDAWRWPLTLAGGLGSERGTPITFLDAIPFYALALRVARGALRPESNFLAGWLAVVCVGQGLAAVAAARLWGVRDTPSVLSAVALSLLLPPWTFRFLHAGLSFHAPLLLSVGLFGAVGRARPERLAAAALAIAWTCLGLNVYLFAMTAGLAGALCWGLVRAGWPARRAAVALAIFAAASLVTMAALGYFEPHGDAPGFERYSMNLASPFWPPRTALLGGLTFDYDVDGGQYEGFAYLGLGLLGLAFGLLVRFRSRLRALARAHLPLVLVAAGFALFALSTRVRFLSLTVFDLPEPPWLAGQFRVPGRFVWPLLYAVVFACVAAAARALPRGRSWLGVAVAVQLVDGAPAIERWREAIARPSPPRVVREVFDRLVGQHRRFVLLPPWQCIAESAPAEVAAATRSAASELVYHASRARPPVTSFYSARPSETDCRRLTAATRQRLDGADLVAMFAAPSLLPEESMAGWRCARGRSTPAVQLCSALPQAAPLLGAALDVAPPFRPPGGSPVEPAVW